MKEVILSLLTRGCYSLKHIQQAHGLMVNLGLEQDNRLLSRFIETCSSLGFSNYAYSVFTRTPHPDIYLYNTMIKALSPSEAAISVYNRIQLAGLRPDTYSIPFVLKTVARLASVEIGRQVHCHSIGTGLDNNVTVLTALVHMYSSCGSVSDARRLFDAAAIIFLKDVALWNAMIAGYTKLGDVDTARQLFETMPLNKRSNVISWTALISGYAQVYRPADAIMVFRRMQQLHNVRPDEIAMLAALSACAQLGALRLGDWIHSYIHKHGFSDLLSLNNALIDMYAKSGSIRKALQVFHSTKYKTVVTWTTMIAGLALHGLGTQALDLFAQMESAQIAPNDITFIAILSACSHAHLVETGLCYFNIMVSRYRIEPKIVHYGCMVDLLGRAGFLQEAQELVSQMPFEANAAIWGSLLAASNIQGNDELGEHALQHLIMLEPQNSGNYSLLSNTYTALGRWNESRMLRKVMRDYGVKKMPGRSSIEVNSIVHGFIAGDKSHSEGERIYEVMYNLFTQSTLAGHPQHDCGELHEFDD